MAYIKKKTHIQSKCANVLKKKKTYITVLDDDMDYDTLSKRDKEDLQPNKITFNSQFESGKDPTIHVNTVVLTDR